VWANESAKKAYIFTGQIKVRRENYWSLFGNLSAVLICFLIWECKLEKKLKAFSQLWADYYFLLLSMEKSTDRTTDSRVRLGEKMEYQIARAQI
jgi:hypothetical protein